MTSNHNIAIAFVATIAIVYGGCYLLGSQQNVVSAPEPNNAAKYFQAIREAEAKRTTGPPVEAPGASNAETARQFQSSRDYRALYESLLQSKADNAGLYARYILSLCLDTQELKRDAMPMASDRQREAYELMTGRCAGFTLAELNSLRGSEMSKHRSSAQGAMLELKWRWDDLKPGDPSRKALLETILRSKEPLVLGEVGPALMRAPESATSVKFKLNEVDSRPFARGVYFAAWAAATCEVSAAGCGLGDPMVVETCARWNTCLGSRQEVIRHEVAGSYGNDALALFDSVLPQLVSAIQSGDVSAFGL